MGTQGFAFPTSLLCPVSSENSHLLQGDREGVCETCNPTHYGRGLYESLAAARPGLYMSVPFVGIGFRDDKINLGLLSSPRV